MTYKNKHVKQIFLLLCFTMLIIPVCKIDTNEKSITENRALTPMPALWKDNKFKLNRAFPQQFSAYLNDRFNGRKNLLHIHDKLEKFLQGTYFENEKAFIGKDGWLFYKGDNLIELYQNRRNFSFEEMELIKNNIIKQNEWFNKHGMKYIIFIPPNKCDIYGEFYKPGIHKAGEIDRIQALNRFLENSSADRVIYPLNELLAAKDETLVYWKNDTHWSPYGAYIGYQKLIHVLNKRYPEFGIKPIEPVFEIAEYKKGDITPMLNLGKKQITGYIDEYYRVSDAQCSYKIVKKEQDDNAKQYIKTINKNKKYKVIVFRDSFTSNMWTYLSETFGEVIYLWNYHGRDKELEYYQDMLLKEKPDIVIHEMVSRSANVLLMPQNLEEK